MHIHRHSYQPLRHGRDIKGDPFHFVRQQIQGGSQLSDPLRYPPPGHVGPDFVAQRSNTDTVAIAGHAFKQQTRYYPAWCASDDVDGSNRFSCHSIKIHRRAGQEVDGYQARQLSKYQNARPTLVRGSMTVTPFAKAGDGAIWAVEL